MNIIRYDLDWTKILLSKSHINESFSKKCENLNSETANGDIIGSTGFSFCSGTATQKG